MVAADRTGRNTCVPCRLNCVMGKVDVQPANFAGGFPVLRMVLHLVYTLPIDNVESCVRPALIAGGAIHIMA